MIKQAVHLMMATKQREEERYRDKIPTISSVCPLLMANIFILKIPLSLIELIDEEKSLTYRHLVHGKAFTYVIVPF